MRVGECAQRAAGSDRKVDDVVGVADMERAVSAEVGEEVRCVGVGLTTGKVRHGARTVQTLVLLRRSDFSSRPSSGLTQQQHV